MLSAPRSALERAVNYALNGASTRRRGRWHMVICFQPRGGRSIVAILMGFSASSWAGASPKRCSSGRLGVRLAYGLGGIDSSMQIVFWRCDFCGKAKAMDRLVRFAL